VSPTKPFAKASQRAEFSRRLREELERTGREASPAALAREINLYLRPAARIHPSSCRKWLHAQAIPTQEKLQALASLLQVPTSWLRFGEVTALSEPAPLSNPLSADELALIDGWRRLSSGQRRTLRQLLGQLLQVH
jgi:transcriptional regulator with XRE-family HTH domain